MPATQKPLTRAAERKLRITAVLKRQREYEANLRRLQKQDMRTRELRHFENVCALTNRTDKDVVALAKIAQDLQSQVHALTEVVKTLSSEYVILQATMRKLVAQGL